MFKRILVPTDGSRLSQKAIDFAIEFARETGGTLVAISVAEPYLQFPPVAGGLIPDPNIYVEDWQRLHDEQSFKLAHQYVQDVFDAASAEGVPCEKVTAISFNPHEEIVKTIEKSDCDAVFMASHGKKGISKMFLGSETQKVLANSTVPVLLFRS